MLIYDVASGQQTAKLSYGYGERGPEWSPDGKYIAFGSLVQATETPSAANDYKMFDGLLFVWDLAAGDGPLTDQNTIKFDVGGGATWSPDGRLLAAGDEEHSIRVLDFAGKQTLETLSGHSDTLMSFAWSPDGTLLASGSYDRTVRVWDFTSGENIATFEHPDIVNSVAWSRQG